MNEPAYNQHGLHFLAGITVCLANQGLGCRARYRKRENSTFSDEHGLLGIGLLAGGKRWNGELRLRYSPTKWSLRFGRNLLKSCRLSDSFLLIHMLSESGGPSAKGAEALPLAAFRLTTAQWGSASFRAGAAVVAWWDIQLLVRVRTSARVQSSRTESWIWSPSVPCPFLASNTKV